MTAGPWEREGSRCTHPGCRGRRHATYLPTRGPGAWACDAVAPVGADEPPHVGYIGGRTIVGHDEWYDAHPDAPRQALAGAGAGADEGAAP